MLNKNLTAFILLMMLNISCSKEDDPSIIDHQPSDNQETAVVTVDANELQGPIMRIDRLMDILQQVRCRAKMQKNGCKV
jgi:hypothetical protein